MNIGRLRDRVTIQTLKQTRDITGEILETWEDGHTLWASVNMIDPPKSGWSFQPPHAGVR